MTRAPLVIADVVPGGVRSTDFVHRVTNDSTCSRCRKVVPDEEVPVLIWFGDDGEDMLIYCEGCCAGPQQEGAVHD